MKTIKRLLLGLTLGMLLVGCSEDDSLKNPISNDVCECDRVAYIISGDSHFNLPNGGFSVPGRFITINDCTGVQLEKSGYGAVIGDCR